MEFFRNIVSNTYEEYFENFKHFKTFKDPCIIIVHQKNLDDIQNVEYIKNFNNCLERKNTLLFQSLMLFNLVLF